jgi:integrase
LARRLRIQEALALGERDLDPRRGSLLVRNGKGGRRREIGMLADSHARCSSSAGASSRPVKTPAYQGAAGISPRAACRPLLVFVSLKEGRRRWSEPP